MTTLVHAGILSALAISACSTMAHAFQKREGLRHSINKHNHLFDGVSGGKLPSLKIKAYYVNAFLGGLRDHCMVEQLQRQQSILAGMGIELHYERWPAVILKSCEGVAECMKERPDCFPGGSSPQMLDAGGHLDANSAGTLRGVIGNWCAHLKVYDEMSRDQTSFDYFFVFEDDVILSEKFPTVLYDHLTMLPQLWTLTAFDTFRVKTEFSRTGERLRTIIPSDVDNDMINIKIPGTRLLAISGAQDEYWGAQAWLFSARRIDMFKEWVNTIPALPLDWVPKAQSPLHIGMVANIAGATVQRRLLTEPAAAALSQSCSSESESNIISIHGVNLARTYRAMSSRRSQDQGSPREVIVLGMHETGAPDMTRMIQHFLEEPNNAVLCQNAIDNSCGGVWMHTHPNRFSASRGVLSEMGRPDSKNFQEAVAVVMLRHPFSLMRAMQQFSLTDSLRAQRHDMQCSSGTHWLLEPCQYNESSEMFLDKHERLRRLDQPTCPQPLGDCWEKLVSAWNSYSDGYLNHLPNLFHQVIYVRYEDLIENPQPVFEEIARVSRVSPPDSMKKTSRSFSQQEALDKLHAVGYDSKYQSSEMDDMCSEIDKSLMFAFGYRGCQDEFVPERISQIDL